MKKRFAILVSVLFLFSCIGFATALNVTGNITATPTNLAISPGEIIVSDFSIEEIQSSPDLGGLVSSLTFHYGRFIDFASLRVWEDFSTTEPEFELLAFPVGTDIGAVEVGGAFQSSELITLEGKTTTPHIWTTFSAVNSAPESDAQTPIIEGETITFSDGSWVEILEVNEADGELIFNTEAGTNLTAAFPFCTPDKCPTEQEVMEVFNVDIVGEMAYTPSIISGVNNSHVFGWRGNETSWHFIGNIDLSEDFIYNIAPTLTNGFSVNSFEKHTLAIVPSETYDIYAVI